MVGAWKTTKLTIYFKWRCRGQKKSFFFFLISGENWKTILRTVSCQLTSILMPIGLWIVKGILFLWEGVNVMCGDFNADNSKEVGNVMESTQLGNSPVKKCIKMERKKKNGRKVLKEIGEGCKTTVSWVTGQKLFLQ